MCLIVRKPAWPVEPNSVKKSEGDLLEKKTNPTSTPEEACLFIAILVKRENKNWWKFAIGDPSWHQLSDLFKVDIMEVQWCSWARDDQWSLEEQQVASCGILDNEMKRELSK